MWVKLQGVCPGVARQGWGDERHVPPAHRDSNYRMAREALLDHVPIPAAQIRDFMAKEGGVLRRAGKPAATGALASRGRLRAVVLAPLVGMLLRERKVA